MGVENGTNRNIDRAFLFELYTRHRPNLHRCGTIQINYRRTDELTDTVLAATGEN